VTDQYLTKYTQLITAIRAAGPFVNPVATQEFLSLAVDAMEDLVSSLQLAEDNHQSVLEVFRMLLPMVPDAVKPCIEDIIREG
jgi:hypothetical protein